jgi:hypothetical protein
MPTVIHLQVQDQLLLLPAVSKPTACTSLANTYICQMVHQLVVNEAANVIPAPEDAPTKDCYGWDPLLDADDDNSDLDHDSEMPDDAQGKISHNTWQMMDQQFACPNHNSVDKDFMGLDDTLNGRLKRLGDWGTWRHLTLRPRE